MTTQPTPDPTPSDLAAAREIVPIALVEFDQMITVLGEYEKKKVYFSDVANACYSARCAILELARHAATDRQTHAAEVADYQGRLRQDHGIIELMEKELRELREERDALRGLLARTQEALRALLPRYAEMFDAAGLGDPATDSTFYQDGVAAVALTPPSYSDALAKAKKEVDGFKKQLKDQVRRKRESHDILTAKLAEARRDSERLDWLAKASVLDRRQVMTMTSPSEEGGANNLRAAIDSARQGGTT